MRDFLPDRYLTIALFKSFLTTKKIYIDPTWTNQGGDLEHYSFPDYERGLVIDQDIEGLDPLPEPISSTTTEIHELDLQLPGSESLLNIRTTYTGADADYQRSEFARTPLENIQKSFREYYANLYPEIANADDLKFTDNRKENLFTVEESYKIPSIWKPVPNEPTKYTALLQPVSVTGYFDVPKNIQQRTAPYALSYPVDVYNNIHVIVPEEWNIAPVDKVIENEFYQYEYSVTKTGKEISKNTHYKTKSDHIPADRINRYVEDHAKMYGELAYEFTYDKNIADAAKNKLPGITTAILTIIGGVLLMFALYHRYDPKPARYMVHGSPIGGWLVLIAFGLVFTPLRLIYDLASTPELFTGAGWMSWLSVKKYGLFAFSFATQIYNILKVMFSVLLVILFFQRRTSFPWLMTIHLAFNVFFVAGDTIAAHFLTDDPSSIGYRDTIQAVIGASIWIPYLNISERVKETFVIRTEKNDDDEPESEKHEVLDESASV